MKLQMEQPFYVRTMIDLIWMPEVMTYWPIDWCLDRNVGSLSKETLRAKFYRSPLESKSFIVVYHTTDVYQPWYVACGRPDKTQHRAVIFTNGPL